MSEAYRPSRATGYLPRQSQQVSVPGEHHFGIAVYCAQDDLVIFGVGCNIRGRWMPRHFHQF
ncbi:MAG TPA: hypothetical protein DEQ28_04435 [Clostridiales bacterium]|nr:hypothetical protein [Clostridiales bacterium]